MKPNPARQRYSEFLPKPRPLRRGLTLVEALVVVSILGVLIGLILPAVQAAREAGRKVQCVNNLRQIGIALAAHHASEGRYPAGIRPTGTSRSGEPFAWGGLSPQCMLLPYLDQSPLFNSLNIPQFPQPLSPRPSSTAHGVENATSAATVVSTFLCPSDWDQLRPGNNYRGCVGIGPGFGSGNGLPSEGVFAGLVQWSLRDVADGASQTIAFAERLRGSGSPKGFDRRRDLWFTGEGPLLGYPDDPGVMATSCRTLTASSPPSRATTLGKSWIAGRFDDTTYNHVFGPNDSAADCSAAPGIHRGGAISNAAASSRSAHPRGVNILLLDGSVRFVKDGIAIATWRALATRHGSEAVSADW